MSTYVTANGLVIPDLTTILAQVSAAQKAAIDPNLDTSPESPLGQINAVFLAAIRDVWEGISLAYNGFNPNAAEDFLLDALCQLTGTTRAAATFSTLTATVNLNAGVTVPVGTILANAAGAQFETTAVVTSVGSGNYTVPCAAVLSGPVACNAGTLTIVVTPVAGLNSVSNTADAVLGTNQDTDAQLRLRRTQELAANGVGTVDAIQAKLEQYRAADGSAPITQASVQENDSDATDSAGRPPHSIEALIWDGVTPLMSDNTMAQLLWDNHGTGVQIYGTNASGTAVDVNGTSRTVPFSRATQAPIKLRVLFTTGVGYAGDAAVKTELVRIFNDTIPALGASGTRAVKAAAFYSILDRGEDGGVAGVTDITSVQVGLVSGAYAAGNQTLGLRDMPTLDTADIVFV